MLKRLRERAGSESGFTLIELLVVMLILGILAAIAIPAFLNQKDKANDSSAKTMARSMQTAEETCATDNGGSYSPNCTLTALKAIEPTIQTGSNVSALTATPNANGYVVSVTDPTTSNVFTITRDKTATPLVVRSCTTANTGGCQNGGTW
jgi:type IV pilus assembly protein PilA